MKNVCLNTLALLLLLLGVTVPAWSCNNYPLTLTGVSPPNPTINGTFSIYGQNLGDAHTSTVLVSYEGQQYELPYGTSTMVAINGVNLWVPKFWIGKTVELLVAKDCDGDEIWEGSDTMDMVISSSTDLPTNIDFSHWDFRTYMEYITDQYDGLGVTFKAEGSWTTPCGGDPDCTTDLATSMRDGTSGRRLGGQYVPGDVGNRLQFGLNYVTVEFREPVETLSIFGQSDTSTSSGLSYYIDLWDWDDQYLGALHEYDCEQGCTTDIAFAPTGVTLSKYIKKITLGGVMGITWAYFDNLEVLTRPAGMDFDWDEIIQCYNDAGQKMDDFSLGETVTAKVKFTVRDSAGKTYKVKFNSAKMTLKHYPVGDPRRKIKLVNTRDPSKKYHTRKNLTNGVSRICKLEGTLPTDPGLVGTEFKIKGKLHLYYQNPDGTTGDQILVYQPEQDYWGIIQ